MYQNNSNHRESRHLHIFLDRKSWNRYLLLQICLRKFQSTSYYLASVILTVQTQHTYSLALIRQKYYPNSYPLLLFRVNVEFKCSNATGTTWLNIYHKDFKSAKIVDQLCMRCYISAIKRRIMQEHLILNI